MGKLFGTDGIRGIVNKDLNACFATKIGICVARALKEKLKREKITFLIGSDTRISKDMLTMAISTGVLSEGCDIINLGVLPTPAISYLVTKYNADGAFIISASHNPSEYNGIKVLDENGFKVDEELENKIEKYVLEDSEFSQVINGIGQYLIKNDAINDYVKHLKNAVTEDLSALNIIVDTANGAAYKTVERIFEDLNVNYTLINNSPNGLNINEKAGSTNIEGLRNKILEGNYDLGVAYDGDADRCILIDEKGNEVDGDYILAICGFYFYKQGKLKNNTLVGTVMSNMGLLKFCEEHDLKFIRTKVGDKYVLEEMLKNNYILGGEQSGHIIFKNFANTGDGQLTSLQILNIMAKEKKKYQNLQK